MRRAASSVQNRSTPVCNVSFLNRVAGVAAVAITLLLTIFSGRVFFRARGECNPPGEIHDCRYFEEPHAFLLIRFKSAKYKKSPCQSDPKEQCLSAVNDKLLEKCNEAVDIANRCQEGLRPKLENVFKSLMAFSSVLFLVFNLRPSHETPSPLQTTQGGVSPRPLGNPTP